MSCPVCQGPVRTVEREYHVAEIADDGDERFWACDLCSWVASQKRAWQDKPWGPPTTTGLGRQIFEGIEEVLERWSETGETPQLRKRHASLTYQLDAFRRQAERIRDLVGNAGPRPLPEIERRFAQLVES